MCVSDVKKEKNGWCKEEDQKRAEEHRNKLRDEYIKRLKEAQKEG
jgi:ribosome recycling factor